MTDKAPRAADYVAHMREAVGCILDYTAGLDEGHFLATRLVRDAVIRNNEVLGEAARNVSRHAPEVAEAHPEIPWADIYAMRNRLAHGYFDVDPHAVWQVVARELPLLGPLLDELARKLEPPP